MNIVSRAYTVSQQNEGDRAIVTYGKYTGSKDSELDTLPA